MGALGCPWTGATPSAPVYLEAPEKQAFRASFKVRHAGDGWLRLA